MLYIVYQTTNSINGKIYVGCHRTSNLEDGYLGSGTLLANAVKKYGKENFTREILSFHDTAADMYKEEKTIVNEKFIEQSSNYNIRVGGWGGKASREVYDKISATLKGVTKSEETRKRMSNAQSGKTLSIETRKKISESSSRRPPISEETRQKLSNSAKTAKNKSAGTIWVTDGIKNKRISKDSDVPEGWHRGRK
jgi:group I intron endonuclease